MAALENNEGLEQLVLLLLEGHDSPLLFDRVLPSACQVRNLSHHFREEGVLGLRQLLIHQTLVLLLHAPDVAVQLVCAE